MARKFCARRSRRKWGRPSGRLVRCWGSCQVWISNGFFNHTFNMGSFGISRCVPEIWTTRTHARLYKITFGLFHQSSCKIRCFLWTGNFYLSTSSLDSLTNISPVRDIPSSIYADFIVHSCAQYVVCTGVSRALIGRVFWPTNFFWI